MNHLLSTVGTFPIDDFEMVKIKMLNWANRFNIFCMLDNQHYSMLPHSQECLLAAGSSDIYEPIKGKAFEQLQDWLDQKKGWVFGHLGYDLKNEIELLSSKNPDAIFFPDMIFFRPKIVVQLHDNEIIIESSLDPELIYKEILSEDYEILYEKKDIEIKSRIEKEEYVSIINKLKEHIQRGDCYEINFCMEFYAQRASIDPVHVYQKLSQHSPNPFSAFYKLDDKMLICASPERYLKKEGSKILSQPIKGTSVRHINNEEADRKNKTLLQQSAKEKAENVMIVDLVRNDLSKICEEGTVQVDELFGVYSFPQVHQMISTISGQLKKNISFSEIIRATFPMGSMTGAPKKRVMELIEKYEKTKRGIFSGAVGYINPEGDFDFNVVIRSIMYNQSEEYLSYQAGSGITFQCNAEDEWEECLSKVSAIKKLLTE